MLSLFFGTIILLNFSFAGEIVRGGNPEKRPGQSSVFAEPMVAETFFEPLRPENPRDPSWPEKLTWNLETSISQEQFEARLEGVRWRTAYHCNGRPIDARRLKRTGYDGLYRGYLEHVYKSRRLIRTENFKQGKMHGRPSETLDDTSYSLSPLGEGKFQIKFNGDFTNSTLQFARINETGELIVLRGRMAQATCPDESAAEYILIPIDTPVG